MLTIILVVLEIILIIWKKKWSKSDVKKGTLAIKAFRVLIGILEYLWLLLVISYFVDVRCTPKKLQQQQELLISIEADLEEKANNFRYVPEEGNKHQELYSFIEDNWDILSQKNDCEREIEERKNMIEGQWKEKIEFLLFVVKIE